MDSDTPQPSDLSFATMEELCNELASRAASMVVFIEPLSSPAPGVIAVRGPISQCIGICRTMEAALLDRNLQCFGVGSPQDPDDDDTPNIFE